MTKSTKEVLIVAAFTVIGTIVFAALASVYDSTACVLLAMAFLVGPMLVYSVVRDYRREKPVYERAKRIRLLKEKMGIVQPADKNKETNKGIAITSFLTLCLIAAACCLEHGYTGVGLVFLLICLVIIVIIRLELDCDCEGKNETAKTESQQ